MQLANCWWRACIFFSFAVVQLPRMLNRCVKGISAVGTKHPLPLCSANQRRCSRPCNKTALYTLREVFSRRGYLSRIKRRRSLPERHGTHGRHTGHEHHEHDLQATKDGQRITAIGLGANVLLSVALVHQTKEHYSP
jgi:hypothetical protein